jgi:hypothetical protein
VTGKSAKSAYTIKTPASTIGLRGTTFDGFVDDEGEIALLLLDGEIDVCNSACACKRLNRAGYFLHIRRNGIISDLRKSDGTFLGDVNFGHAFPFIGQRLRISPRIRFRRADLLGGRRLRRAVVPRHSAPYSPPTCPQNVLGRDVQAPAEKADVSSFS